MKNLSLIAAVMSATFWACMPARQGDIDYGQGGPGAGQPGYDRAGESQDGLRNEPANSRGRVKMNLPMASLAALEIQTDALYYTVKYEDDAGKELASRPRTKLVVDPQTNSGVVELKVPDKTSGYVSMTLEEDVANGAKFAGKSDKISIDGPTKVSLKLALIDDTADISVDVTFDDDQNNSNNNQNNQNNQNQNNQNSGPDVSGIANAELAALVKTVGDPKTMGTPTYAKLKPVIDRFCGDCHVAGRPYGDTGTEAFFAQRRVNGKLAPKAMPNPGSPYANDMDALAAAGFDYRKAMIDLARSLGNNN